MKHLKYLVTGLSLIACGIVLGGIVLTVLYWTIYLVFVVLALPVDILFYTFIVLVIAYVLGFIFHEN